MSDQDINADQDGPQRLETPETINSEQNDEAEQAQTVAKDALGKVSAELGNAETEKADFTDDNEINPSDTPDLVDTMDQMVSSGNINYHAYRGERNDDDTSGSLGRRNNEDRDIPLSDE